MSVMLPGWAIPPLSWIGLHWPDIDEDQLFDIAENWGSTAQANFDILQRATAAAQNVIQMDHLDVDDQAIDEFQQWFYGPDGPAERLKGDSTGADLLRLCCYVMAIIVIALKIYFVYALISLIIEVANAIAASPFTFGAATASIPAFIAFTRALVEAAIHAAVSAIEAEIKNLLVKVAVRQVAAALGHIAGGGNVGDAAAGMATGGWSQVTGDLINGRIGSPTGSGASSGGGGS
jgi:hypothetical protein